MKKTALLLCILLILCCSLPAYGEIPAPDDILGEAALLMDADTGQVLYEKNGYRQMAPASITKILTALLALECLDENASLTASARAVDTPAWGSSAYIQVGERLTVRQALYALMLRSANEAGNILAEEVAGSLEEFSAMMNERAIALGARGTHFSNAHGLPARNHYTTAYDMALITRQALQTPGFLTYFGADTFSMAATNQSGGRTFTNTHRMLLNSYGVYNEEVIGGKTGYTMEAGYTLVTAAQRNGRTLICVVLNSDSYYADTQALLDFGFEEFSPYSYLFDEVDPMEASILEDGWEAGRAYFQQPKWVELWLHDSINPSRITAEYLIPESLSPSDRIAGSALLYYPGGSGLPEEMLSIPLEVEVASFPPPVVETITIVPAAENPRDPFTLAHAAVILGSMSIVIGLVLLSLRAKRNRGNMRKGVTSRYVGSSRYSRT